MLKSLSWTCSGIQQYRASLCSFDVLLPLDPPNDSPFLQHSLLSRSESPLQISNCGFWSVLPNLFTARFLGTNANSQGSLIGWTTGHMFRSFGKIQPVLVHGWPTQTGLHLVSSITFKIRFCLPSNHIRAVLVLESSNQACVVCLVISVLVHSVSSCTVVITCWFRLWSNNTLCLLLHSVIFVFLSSALCSTHAPVRCKWVSPLFLEVCSDDVVVFQLRRFHFVRQIHWHQDWAKHVACWVYRLVFCKTSVHLVCISHWDNLINTVWMYSINLFQFRSRTRLSSFLLHRSPLWAPHYDQSPFARIWARDQHRVFSEYLPGCHSQNPPRQIVHEAPSKSSPSASEFSRATT